ncbi:MAG: ATP-binding protein [Acutalibacter sp.]|nr:ATP-binding protein [Acutalibacter sp.]
MNGFERILEQAAEKAYAHGEPGDYLGPDGLLVCGTCGTAKQCRVTFVGRERVVGCLCGCGVRRREEEKRQAQEAQRRLRENRARRGAVASGMLREARFEAAQPTGLIAKAKNYAANWQAVREHNVGLLLMGGVGVGKSYAAACICNALLDQGVPCLMTSFGQILGMEWEERGRFVSRLSRYELLVLDDLGAQRDSPLGKETMFNVVDQRYRAKKPLIVTTNLGMGDLNNPKNINEERVFDRLLEVCGPVICEGENFRQKGGRATRRALREAGW